MKVRLFESEWYPVISTDSNGLDAGEYEMTDEMYQRMNRVYAEFEAMQGELMALTRPEPDGDEERVRAEKAAEARRFARERFGV